MMDFCSLRTFDEWRGDDNSDDVEEAEKPWHGVIVMACRRTAATVRSIRDRIMVNWISSVDDERVRGESASEVKLGVFCRWEEVGIKFFLTVFFRRSINPTMIAAAQSTVVV